MSKPTSPLLTELLRDVETFLVTTGTPATAFGVAAVNDGHFVRDLRSGRDLRVSTVESVRAFMTSELAARNVAAAARSEPAKRRRAA